MQIFILEKIIHFIQHLLLKVNHRLLASGTFLDNYFGTLVVAL